MLDPQERFVRFSAEHKRVLVVRPFPAIRLKGSVSIAPSRSSPTTKLTGGRPEINNQADNDDGVRHKVQPEWFVMLQTHKVTRKSGAHISELYVQTGTGLGTDQPSDDPGTCEIYSPKRRPKKSEDNKLRL